MTPGRWLTPLIAALALGALGCNRRAPGTCREDVDCPAGFDCTAGACVHRERLRFGAAGAPVVAPTAAAPAAPRAPADVTPAPRQDGAAPATPKAVTPPAQPPAPPAPEPSLPAWKRRLKNT